ncbi:MAG: hypothetical protein SH817_09005 [Leptospira sp.]|nr:hypothetical protein [Leptospira sp.]
MTAWRGKNSIYYKNPAPPIEAEILSGLNKIFNKSNHSRKIVADSGIA